LIDADAAQPLAAAVEQLELEVKFGLARFRRVRGAEQPQAE